MKRFVQIGLWLLVGVAGVKGQTTYDWLNTAPDGNWRQGASGARWDPGGLFDQPPYGRLRFNNNGQVTMSNNVPGVYSQFQVEFAAGATTVRTIGGNTLRFFDFTSTWPRISNLSTATHVMNLPIEVSDGTPSGWAGIELLTNNGSLTFGGGITGYAKNIYIYGNNVAASSARSVLMNSGITGTGFVNVSQFGVLRLNAAQTYTGQTQVDNGELWIESSGSIAAGSGIFVGNGSQVTNTAKLWLSNTTGGTTFSNNFTINQGNASTREIGGLNTSGTHTFSGNITNNSTNGLLVTALNAGGTLTLSGVNSGANTNPYNYQGAGIIILSGNSSYQGVSNIAAGTLVRLGGAGSGTASPLGNTTNRTNVVSGGVLDLNGFSLVTSEDLTLNGTGISSGGALTNSSATAANWIGILTLGSAASIVANNGAINLTNTGSAGGSGAFTLTLAGSTGGSLAHNMLAAGSVGAITKEGSGTWTLSGASTYTGATTINAGTLRISGGVNRLPIATAVTIANTAGATLDLNSLNQQIGSLAGGGTTGGAVTLGSGTLTVGNTTNTNFGGNISGTGGLTKVGTGTLTISGNNGYSGTTTISAGRLEYNSNAAMALGSNISLGGGTLAVGNTPTALSAGTLSMTSSSTIDLGGGTNSYSINFSGVGAPFTGTLTISNWSGLAGKEIILPGLTVDQLAQINFTSYGTGAKYDLASPNRIIPAGVYETITSGSGFFTESSSWTNGVPPLESCSGNPPTIIIRGTFRLIQDVNRTVARIENNGIYQSNAFTITLCNGGSIVNNGIIDFSSSNATLICNGTATFSGSASPNNYRLDNLILNNVTTFTTPPTIARTLQLNTGSSIAGNAPFYANNGISTLFYNATTFTRGLEWATGVTAFTSAGYPLNVTIGSSTQACAFSAVNNGALQMAGNLTIGATSGLPSSFTLNENSTNVRPLTVLGNVVINATGSLTLGTLFSPNAGDLYVAGNFFTNNGTFNHNGRALFMVGGSTQFLNGTLNATGAANCLPFLLIDKSGGTVNLNTPVNVTSTLTLTNGTITLGTNNLTITSGNAIAGGTFGTSRMIITDGTGQLVFGIPNDGANTDIFPIGDGTNYTPITINVTGSTGTNRTIGMRVVDAAVPNTPLNTPTSPTHYITRYWVPSSSGFTSISWNGIATYAASGDAVGTAANIRFSVWHPAPENSWMDYGAGPSGQTLTGGTNITDLNSLGSSAFITGREAAPKLFYRSNATTMNWSSSASWQTSPVADFGSGLASALVPPSAMNSSGITIRNGHTVNIDASTTLDQCVVATGSTLIKGAANLSISDGSGTDFTVQNGAVFRHSGDPMTTIAGTGLVQTGGMIEVTTNSAGVNLYASSANIDYETNAVFYWNINAVFASSGIIYFPDADANTIPIFRTGAVGAALGGTNPLIINGLLQADGTLNFVNGGSKTFRNGIIGSGHVIQRTIFGIGTASGAFIINGNTAQIGGTGDIALNGNGLQITGGTTTLINNKPIIDTLVATGGTFTVQTGAILNASAFALTGTARYTQQAGATLITASTDGVGNTPSLSTGSIRLSGTKTFSPGANYTFNGTTDQSTGNLMGTSIGNLTIANTGTTNNTVTLSNPGNTVSTLNLNSGVLACGLGQTLNIAGGGTIDIPASGGAGRQATGINAGTINFIGTGTVNARQTGLPQLTNVVVNATSVSFSGGSASNATINGTLELRAGANISNAPFYANGSTLIYNTGGDYNRQVEWGTLSGPGYPHHVRIQGGTTLLANLSALTVSTWNMGGNLELGTTGSVGNLNFNGGTVRMIVNGNVVIGSNTGTSLLTLGGISGPNAGDLEIKGSFTRTANGDINFGSGLGRAVFFTGAVPATISAPAAQNFPFLIIDKGGSTANTLTLNQSVNVTQRLILTSGRVITSSSNLLRITNSAPDDASNGIVYSDVNPAYIDGPLMRDVNTTSGSNSYIFPVGRWDGSTHFAKRIRMKELTNGTGSFTVSYERGNPPGGFPYTFQDVIKGIRQSEYWNVDRTTGSTQGRIVLPYNYLAGNTWLFSDGSLVTPNIIARVAVVRGSGANWNVTDPLNSAFSTEGSEPEGRLVNTDGDISSRHIDAFSPFTFGWGLNQVLILPLKLLGFTAKATGPDALLQWQYADAKDLAFTTIEYSTDGQRFRPLQRVAGTTALHYSHTHLQPGSGIHYYRLLMADKNGETSFSAVQVVQIGVNQSYITGLLQNPVQGAQAMVQGYSATAQPVRVLLTEVQGRRLLAATYQVAQGSFSLPVSLLPVAKGNYYLQLMLNDGTSKTMKVVY